MFTARVPRGQTGPPVQLVIDSLNQLKLQLRLGSQLHAGAGAADNQVKMDKPSFSESTARSTYPDSEQPAATMNDRLHGNQARATSNYACVLSKSMPFQCILEVLTSCLRAAAFKTKGMGFASFLKDKTVQASTQLKQKSTEPDASGQTAYDRVRLATSQ